MMFKIFNILTGMSSDGLVYIILGMNNKNNFFICWYFFLLENYYNSDVKKICTLVFHSYFDFKWFF